MFRYIRMVFTPSNKANLQAGINSWISDAATFRDASVAAGQGSGTNGDINTWDVTSAGADFSELFKDKTTFNSDISNWNTAAVTTMYSMFLGATAFNQYIGSWTTANVTDMTFMFANATAFNQNIGSWNTSKVITMRKMFVNATAFNQDIGSWNTAAVIYMRDMFFGATDFDQNIRGWNTSSVTDMVDMFNGATAMHSTFSGVTGFSATPTQAFFNQPIPQLTTSKPNDNATNVSITSPIVLNFDRNVDVETGNITIKKTGDNTIIETIDITSSQVTGTGTKQITIKPSTRLPFRIEMYVLIDRTCFDDNTSLSYPGITNTTTLSFTTAKKPSKKKKQTDIIKQEAETISTDQGELTFTQVQQAIKNGKELTMNGGLITIKAAIQYTSDNDVSRVIYITSQHNQINYIYNEMVEAKKNGNLNSVLTYYINIYNGSDYYTNLINAFANSLL